MASSRPSSKTPAAKTRTRRAAAGPDIAAILAKLDSTYPDARCSLDYANPLQLLVATILSAQCTDKRVNMVTPALFTKYPAAPQLAAAPLDQLERDIQSTGFFRNKAKNLRAMAAALVQRHGNNVPNTMDDLVNLPGVGRKTANVVLGNAFDINVGVVVDTHVARLCQRLGLTQHTDPVKIEQDLMRLIPADRWCRFSHQLIAHGRSVCMARNPDCAHCPLLSHCPDGKSRMGQKAAGKRG
jgi:endonuclease-3